MMIYFFFIIFNIISNCFYFLQISFFNFCFHFYQSILYLLQKNY